jgi:hypothetical protein
VAVERQFDGLPYDRAVLLTIMSTIRKTNFMRMDHSRKLAI